MNDIPALSDAFYPPKGFVGVAAMMAAMSADATVLEQVMQAFTGDSTAQRAARGVLTAALFVDAAEPIIEATSVPGLYQAPPGQRNLWRSTTVELLLHAKLAVLGFAVSPSAKIERLRLIIHTGNWTVQSAKRDIDLVWWCDLLLSERSHDRQASSDIQAAVRFFKDLERYFEPLPNSERIEELKRAAGSKRKGVPTRFVSTVEGPLIDQVAGRLCSGANGVHTQLNWLTIGSAFFEQESNQGGIPRVLADLPQRISGLTANARKAVVFNPKQAGAVASWWNAGAAKRSGWRGHLPVDPLEAGREFMHAKFILGGRRATAGFSRARLYIGSGNLSLAGFYSAPKKPVRGHANIEVGIVLNLDDEADSACAKLPIGIAHGQVEVVSGELPDEARSRDYIAPPPVLYGQIIEGGGVRLQWSSEPCESELDVGDGRILSVSPNIEVISTDKEYTPPAAMRVRRKLADAAWQTVPILDADNSFCRAPAPRLMFDEVIDAVLAFPDVPASDDSDEPDGGKDGDDDGGNDGDNNKRRGGSRPERRKQVPSTYPVYLGMRLIEAIADRNQRIRLDEYKAWFRHLRRVLVDRPDEATRLAVAGLQANIFASLAMQNFAPPVLGDEQRSEYLKLLNDIAQAWGVSAFENPAH